ncbi:hypothetical protein M378DRAFT_168096 [Amanita muscaria Koide BX008]|uniref:Uncharacterized protein n=1 Tax=Amanita muscaria (strain Koide BX008) TaxID=946122 RepID=A0A0C2T1Z4_AMAMK|nr:hypothetical protein M378DRAFT_168096 [Amanita muscaria Koide BX008]
MPHACLMEKNPNIHLSRSILYSFHGHGAYTYRELPNIVNETPCQSQVVANIPSGILQWAVNNGCVVLTNCRCFDHNVLFY